MKVPINFRFVLVLVALFFAISSTTHAADREKMEKGNFSVQKLPSDWKKYETKSERTALHAKSKHGEIRISHRERKGSGAYSPKDALLKWRDRKVEKDKWKESKIIAEGPATLSGAESHYMVEEHIGKDDARIKVKAYRVYKEPYILNFLLVSPDATFESALKDFDAMVMSLEFYN